jgi:hypothetical protein
MTDSLLAQLTGFAELASFPSSTRG